MWLIPHPLPYFWKQYNMALEPTTKLAAINTMMSSIGEAPVNSLDSQRSDVLTAISILEEITREVLSYGWHFNTAINVVMTPETSSGYILVPPGLVRVDTEGENSSVDPVINGNRLFNRVTNSFSFNAPIKTTQVYLMEFSDIPEIGKRYITVRSSRVFQDRVLGSTKQHSFSQMDETQALARLTEYEGEIGDYSMLDSPDVWRILIRRSYRMY